MDICNSDDEDIRTPSSHQMLIAKTIPRSRDCLPCSQCPGVLATATQSLLKRVVGGPTKLEVITTSPLTSDTLFLTSLTYFAHWCYWMRDRLATPSSIKLATEQGRHCISRNYGQPRDDVDDDDDETPYEDYDQNSDNDEEYLSDVVDKPSSSRTRIRWPEDDDNRLGDLKNKNKPWGWICDQFPDRSPGVAHEVAEETVKGIVQIR